MAGDFYDIVRLDDGTIVIVVADVAGKGVGASLIMASVKAVLPFVAREGAQRAMSMLNAKLVNELGKREFVALAYARFNPAGRLASSCSTPASPIRTSSPRKASARSRPSASACRSAFAGMRSTSR